MKNTRATALLTLLFLSALNLHASDCVATAGGVSLAVPPPEKVFTEVGGDKRDSFEYMVPSRNRLLCAFVPTHYLAQLKNPATGMDRYMVVEVSRRFENTDITAANFGQVVASMKQQIGDASQLNSNAQASKEEVVNKLKAVQNSKDISLDKTIPLGAFLQTTDRYGFLLLQPVSSGGTTVRTIGASILLRVRNRLIFAYVYGSDDESSLKWVQATAEEWSREILAANSAN